MLPGIQRADRSFAIHGPSKTARNPRAFRSTCTPADPCNARSTGSRASEQQLLVLHSLLDLAGVGGRDRPARRAVRTTGMDPRSFTLTKYALASLNPDVTGPLCASPRTRPIHRTAGQVVRVATIEDYDLAAFPGRVH